MLSPVLSMRRPIMWRPPVDTLTEEVFKHDGNFYQATQSVPKGTDLSEMTLPVDFNRGLVQIGPALPKKSEAAGLAWPNGNDLQTGEVFYFLGAGSTSNVDGAFFMATNAVAAGSNADPSNSTKDFIRVGALSRTIPFKLSKRLPKKKRLLRLSTGNRLRVLRWNWFSRTGKFTIMRAPTLIFSSTLNQRP